MLPRVDLWCVTGEFIEENVFASGTEFTLLILLFPSPGELAVAGKKIGEKVGASERVEECVATKSCRLIGIQGRDNVTGGVIRVLV